jgi:L-fuculose-phosphate aldolase
VLGLTQGDDIYWMLRFSLGFDEATVEDFIEVEKDLYTVSSVGNVGVAARDRVSSYVHVPYTP